MIKWWQYILFKIAKPISQFIAGAHMPFSRKRMTADTYLDIRKLARPGDVLLTFTYGEASVWFIPGKYKHIGWYMGDDKVLEASTHGVRISHLSEFVFRKDGIGCFRSKFATEQEMIDAVSRGAKLEGKEYDFEFNTQNDQWYCSEIVFMKTKEVLEEAGKEMPFKLQPRLGVDTIAPDDFRRAAEKWDCILERP